MATPDPRRGGDDQPTDSGWGAELPNSQPPPNLPPIRRPQDEPVAPEPAWHLLDEENERLKLQLQQRHHFNRERFLLRCVAYVLFIQFGVWGIVGLTCAGVFFWRATKILGPYSPVCMQTQTNFQKAADSSLSVLLALLGGGALAAGEIQRKREREEDPRRGGGDQP